MKKFDVWDGVFVVGIGVILHALWSIYPGGLFWQLVSGASLALIALNAGR